MLSQESPTRCSVFSLENKLVRGPETHRYHRNEAILPHRSKERPKGLACVPGPMIVRPLLPIRRRLQAHASPATRYSLIRATAILAFP